jgi:hypothetical protein
MLRETRKTAIGLGLAAAMATSCVYAADGQPLPTPKVNEITQKDKAKNCSIAPLYSRQPKRFSSQDLDKDS